MIFGKKLYAGRAAVCTQNTQEQIKTAVVTAYTRFLEVNGLREKDIVSLQFSITSDITAANPATLLRSAGYASATVLFCSTEPNIDGSPHGIIRFLFYYYGKKKAVPIYLGGAEKLRPDLFNHTA
ncbi:chorismate mutase [Treponema sp. OMZ 305]|uniref:chorismate mutase n=1 Tax=Treponema TaxID=157 RepID=UPI001BAFF0C0|nr:MULTISPECIES: chorismate mutase [Treponema]QUY17834.1 chorismate mutase [Treponema vincentii]UTC57710.1 chorismate mutase [Treponema sp. OMZ 305]